jgi:hypothetical protein
VFGSWALLVRALLVRAFLVRALLVRVLLVRALLVRVLLVLVVASSGPGGFRLSRLLQIIAGELWLAG